MNNAELYHKSNCLQKRDALHCLQEYGKKIKWRNFDRVIDLGCGDGGVTIDILKKFMPENYKKLLGCDISEKMIQFANKHYGDERTKFLMVDLEGKLPEELAESFDHAFSFYTLHWINHQERAFTNIYDMLADGGDCLLIFLGHSPLFDVFRILSKYPKWRWWLRDVDRFVSPYHDSQEPDKEIRRMMVKIGFKNVMVECKKMLFIFDKLDVWKKAVAAVNPFEIPPELQEEFLEDYVEVVRGMRLIDEINNNTEVNVKTNYHLLVAYGSK